MNNTSITITTPAGRILIIEGIQEYKYEMGNTTVFVNCDFDTHIYVAIAVRRSSNGRAIESPVVLDKDIDKAIDKAMEALDWVINRVPVQRGENDLYLCHCQIDDQYTVYIFELPGHSEYKYTGYLKHVRGKDIKTVDMITDNDMRVIFNRAYESVQKIYVGWTK